MRQELGWTTQLPRHGQGCKAAIEKLLDSSNNNDDTEVSRGTICIKKILFLYYYLGNLCFCMIFFCLLLCLADDLLARYFVYLSRDWLYYEEMCVAKKMF